MRHGLTPGARGACRASAWTFRPPLSPSWNARLGPLPEEVMRPLTRYFERAVVSLRYAMLNKDRRWSITEGFGALALGFPVALWMLRFACGPRPPEVQDVIHTVMMLDRGETTASLRRPPAPMAHPFALGQPPTLPLDGLVCEMIAGLIMDRMFRPAGSPEMGTTHVGLSSENRLDCP